MMKYSCKVWFFLKKKGGSVEQAKFFLAVEQEALYWGLYWFVDKTTLKKKFFTLEFSSSLKGVYRSNSLILAI